MNGIHARIPIDDKAFWRLPVDRYDLISGPSSTSGRDQLTTMRFDDSSGPWEILLRVSLWVRHVYLANEVNRWLRLRVKHLHDGSAGSHTG